MVPSGSRQRFGRWSFGRPLDAFVAEAVTLPGWEWALIGVQLPRHLTIELEQI
jgi:hypothetical protein